MSSVIDGLLKISNTTSNKNQVQNIFDYKYKGMNCLQAAYQKMKVLGTEVKMECGLSKPCYSNPFKNRLLRNHDGKLQAYESLILYLIQLADINNIDLSALFDHTNELGESFFHNAIMFSEKIAFALIERNVKVNRINNAFTTPYLMVKTRLVIICYIFSKCHLESKSITSFGN